jgi:hypothetical protein
MGLRDDIQRMAHEFAEEDNASFNLWTWLPSYAAAQKAHGDHASNFTPPIADVMKEACEFISHRLHPTPEERAEAGELYECPCGEPHDEAGCHPSDNVGPSVASLPVTFDAFVADLRADIERFAKHWHDSHRTSPEKFPMSFPANDEGAWFEQFLAFVNHVQS